VQALHSLGLSLTFFAAYAVTLIVIMAVVYAGVAVLIFSRRSDDSMALFVSLTLLLFGVVTFSGVGAAVAETYPAFYLPVACLDFLGTVAFIAFLFIFPDGRFMPRWTGWVALAWILQQIPANYFPYSALVKNAGFAVLGSIVWTVALGTVIYSQIYHYRRVSNAAQRRQTKWVVLGIASAALGLVGGSVWLDILDPEPSTGGAMLASLAGDAFVYAVLLLVPASIGIAMLRSHLFDVDLIINRTLVYGALTASIVIMYVLIVGSLSALFQTRGNLVISLLATGAVAVAFQPLRERLQRGVNHLIYGQRDEPYAVLSQLGRRLETTLAPDAVLAVVVETVTGALKLPYATIQLGEGDALADAATFGTPTGEMLDLPLTHQGERVGRLRLGPRATGETWPSGDLRLLDDLARQAGAAAHAVQLTADLQLSRERIVVAREETRRRLRRDLHDGLAPALAGLALKAGAIGDLIPADPHGAQVLSTELEAEIRGAIREIRRLVYELRPPTLDEQGLVAAIRERATTENMRRRANGADGKDTASALQIVVEAPECLPLYSAAVEVAAYRIVQEALTNVIKHAQASRCIVRITAADALVVEIFDDGVGLPDQRRTGVGLLSMRERAEELGGTCKVEALREGGTRVTAHLPTLTQAPKNVQAKEIP
jgi:signal transduction histidine kinase